MTCHPCDRAPFKCRKVKHLPGEENFGATKLILQGRPMPSKRLVYNGDVNFQYTISSVMTSKLKALRDCSSDHFFAEVGACGSPTI